MSEIKCVQLQFHYFKGIDVKIYSLKVKVLPCFHKKVTPWRTSQTQLTHHLMVVVMALSQLQDTLLVH